MKVGVVKETFPGETRIALIPDGAVTLKKKNIEVLVEKGAGVAAGYLDKSYEEKGALIVSKRSDVFKEADILLQVRGLGYNQTEGISDLKLYREGQTVIAFFDPLFDTESVKTLADIKLRTFSMELIPRISRAQSMDALSSMATVAGYKAVILAAEKLPKMFPMMMTAAGTITPARVFIIGAGVAGLQAIATAHRLGGSVKAYDVRPAVKEQVQSLGAKFLELEIDSGDAEDKGGYAKALGEEFYKKQREMMMKVVDESDVVITTALIPGKKAPILLTKEMVEAMPSGSVVVDLAAEKGGNCELTKPGETFTHGEVTIIGHSNLPATAPYHASQMYSKNVVNLFNLLIDKEGNFNLNLEDEVVAGTLLTQDGEIKHSQIREIMGLDNKKEKSDS